jgi:hypothetical protein
VLRVFGLVSLLAALAVGGYLVLESSRSTGPASDAGRLAEERATQAAAGVVLRQAAAALDAHRATAGTYAGATLPPTFGAVLVRADAGGYCLQAGTGAGAAHLEGPGGAPAPGACP